MISSHFQVRDIDAISPQAFADSCRGEVMLSCSEHSEVMGQEAQSTRACNKSCKHLNKVEIC